MSLGRVLVLDYDEVSLFLIRRVLQRKGQEGQLAFAKNREEALQILEEENFDVILADPHQPIEDGASLLNALRQRQEAKGVASPKIVILSSSQETIVRTQNALSPTVTFSLLKPFTDEQVDSLIALVGKPN